MSIPRDSSSFCLICYKLIPKYSQTVDIPENINKFIKTVNRFAKSQNRNVSSFDISAIEKLIDCCSKCKDIINNFTEGYTNLVLLEFKLDYLLNKLGEKISYANKVPTRWIHVSGVLEETFLNDLEAKAESQIRIRKFRQNVIQAGHQRKRRLYPRVVLERNEQIDTLRKPAVLETSIELPKSQNTESHSSRTFFRRGYKSRVCPKCGKKLKSTEGLKIHLEHHKDQSEWKWNCHICPKRFSTKQNLEVHYRSHTGEKPFKCRFCQQDFRYRSDITKHLKLSHKHEKGIEKELKRKWVLKCDPISIDSASSFANQDQHRPEGYDEMAEEEVDYSGCHNDILVDVDEDNLSEDLNGLHNNYDDTDTTNNIKIVETSSVFKDPQIQIKLEHSEANTLVNETDDFHFTMESNTASHISMETVYEAQPQQNPVIGRKSGKLECSKCGKKLKTSYGLQIHLEYHKDPKDWTWACKTCGKNCATRQNLKTHMTTHTRLSNFKCQYCEGKYRHMSSLNNHLLNKHPNEKSAKEEFERVKTPTNRMTDFHINQDKVLANEEEVVSEVERPQSRYSLREKRVTSFLSDEIYSDDDNYEENEFQSVDSLSVESVSKPEKKKTDSKTKVDQSEILKPDLEEALARKLKGSIPGPRSSKAFLLKCEVCSRKFTSFLHKEFHFKQSHDLTGKTDMSNTIKCKRDNCSAYFFTKTQLFEHHKKEHPNKTKREVKDNKKKDLVCPKCGRKFMNQNKFDEHLEYHKDPSEWKWECKICGKRNATKLKLNDHKKIHSRSRNPYSLREKRMSNFKETDNNGDDDEDKVKRVKKKGKSGWDWRQSLKFECKVCKGKYASALKREQHFKKSHDLSKIGEDGKVEKCGVGDCTAYFLETRQLYLHRWWQHYKKGEERSKKEDGNKKFVCGKCGKGFTLKNSLSVHLLYHQGPSGWKFKCEVCGKKCATKYKLKEHVTTHTKETRYECRFCGERFAVVNMFSRHLKKYHAKEVGGGNGKGGNFGMCLEEVIFVKKKNLSGSMLDGIFKGFKEGVDGEKGNSKGKDGEDLEKDKLLEGNEKMIIGEKGSDDVEGENGKGSDLEKNFLARKGDCFGEGTLVEFEDLDRKYLMYLYCVLIWMCMDNITTL